MPFYLSFSDDGRRMATVEFNRREAVVWDVATGKNARPGAARDGRGGLRPRRGRLHGLHRRLRRRSAPLGRRRRTTVPRSGGQRPATTAWARSYGSPAPGGRFVAYTGRRGRHLLRRPVRHGDGDRSDRRRASDVSAGGAWHPDGVHFALATGDQIRVWDARNGRLTARARASGPDVSAIDYSADGNALVVGELSGRVTLLDQDLHPTGSSGPARPAGRQRRRRARRPQRRGAHGLRQRIGVLGRRARPLGAARPRVGQRRAGRATSGSGAPTWTSPPTGVTWPSVAGRERCRSSTPRPGSSRASRAPHRSTSLNWLTYSADGSRVLTSGVDAMDALWDGDTGELLARVATPERFTVAGFGRRSRLRPHRGRVRRAGLRVGHPARTRRRVRVPRRRPRLHRGRVVGPLRRPAVPARLPAAGRLTVVPWREPPCTALSI